MNRLKKISMLLLGFSLLFSACLNLDKPINKIEFYTLEYDPPKLADLEPLAHVIRVEHFSVAPIYKTNLIIYRDRSFKRDAYVYHKWRANPADLVSQYLIRDMKQSGLFKAVLPHKSRLPSSHMLEGSVDEFFEWDLEKKWNAILSATIALMAENEPDITKRILFQKTYRAKKQSKQKNPRALAEAMSIAMSEISEKIIMDIYNSLKDRNKKHPSGS